MFSYWNYARVLENKIYEATDVGDMNNAVGIAKVLSGKDYAMYENQWNQFVDQVQAQKKIKGKDFTFTALINHDDNKKMCYITFEVKGGKLDWMSLTAGGQDLVKAYSDYKGLETVFLPNGQIEGGSSTTGVTPAGGDAYSAKVDTKAAASADKSVIDYDQIKKWADSLAGYTDAVKTTSVAEVIDIFSKLLTPDFKASLGRRAKFAGKFTKAEEEMDAIAALARAFCDEESPVSNSGTPEDWPGEAEKFVPKSSANEDEKAKMANIIKTVKPEFNRQWGMWVKRRDQENQALSKAPAR